MSITRRIILGVFISFMSLMYPFPFPSTQGLSPSPADSFHVYVALMCRVLALLTTAFASREFHLLLLFSVNIWTGMVAAGVSVSSTVPVESDPLIFTIANNVVPFFFCGFASLAGFIGTASILIPEEELILWWHSISLRDMRLSLNSSFRGVATQGLTSLQRLQARLPWQQSPSSRTQTPLPLTVQDKK
ncbi:hypothetical protein DFH06DRAFT_310695 [Mycena polygramma]|nr:hypothetical protein DFH06DRAFT_310695 [Mycena polygramma]